MLVIYHLIGGADQLHMQTALTDCTTSVYRLRNSACTSFETVSETTDCSEYWVEEDTVELRSWVVTKFPQNIISNRKYQIPVDHSSVVL